MTESLERRDRALKLAAIATLLESSRDPSLAHLYPVDEWIQYAAELSLYWQNGESYRDRGHWLANRIHCILADSNLIDDSEYVERLEQKRKALRGNHDQNL